MVISMFRLLRACQNKYIQRPHADALIILGIVQNHMKKGLGQQK